jgi:hypothetical protein
LKQFCLEEQTVATSGENGAKQGLPAVTPSCRGPLGLATEEILDSAISASSVDDQGWDHYYTHARLNSNKGWCADLKDEEKYIQIDLARSAEETSRKHQEKLQETIRLSSFYSNFSSFPSDPSSFPLESSLPTGSDLDSRDKDRVTVVGIAMQGMLYSFKTAFVSQFHLLFSNDSIDWSYEEDILTRKQRVYNCSQCHLEKYAADEIIIYNLLLPVTTRYVRVKIIEYTLAPCLRMEIIGCRNQTSEKLDDINIDRGLA